jgi:hypothetical protein
MIIIDILVIPVIFYKTTEFAQLALETARKDFIKSQITGCCTVFG